MCDGPTGRTTDKAEPFLQVYTINLETGEKKRLTNNPEGNCRSPGWSPDAKTLVFESKKSGYYKLYRISSEH